VVQRIVVAGYGPVGREVTALLSARGEEVKIVQRRAPRGLPENAVFLPANLEDDLEASKALAGADIVVCSVGIPYISETYTHAWPVVMRNLLNGCAQVSARFVFADNLYMYGPQTSPLTEDMPLTNFGNKPAVRAQITRMWQQAHAEGRVRAVAVRASDFYGPDTATSVLSTMGVVRLLEGKRALAPYPADQPHDFTYVPDFARAVVTLIDAEDDAYGQAWHVPNAPTRSLRELYTLAATLIGTPPRILVLPRAMMPIIGLFRRDVRELKEMRFQWDRPYLVDTTKFARRFWEDPTPFENGLRETISFYRTVTH
jgi:nucleoside-diphosphate-sugar epimerase